MAVMSLSALLRDRRGVASIYFAAVMTTMVVAMVAALDLMRVAIVHARVQSALDAAVTAAGRNLGAGEAVWKAEASAYFNANMDDGYLGATLQSQPTFSAPDNGDSVRMEATLDVPLMLSAFVSRGALTLNLATEARRQTVPGVEMVMAIDNSSAMSATMAATKTAVQNAANRLLGANSGGDSYVGLVPFTETVNVGNSTRTQGWLDAASGSWLTNFIFSVFPSVKTNFLGKWHGCVMERPVSGSTYSYDKRTPLSVKFNPYYDTMSLIEFGSEKDQSKGIYASLSIFQILWSSIVPDFFDSQQKGCLNARTHFLTGDATALGTSINAMQSNGTMMMSSGLMWGWRMLAPSWRSTSIWGSSTLPHDVSADRTKALVLVVGGDNNIMRNPAFSLETEYFFFGSFVRYVSPYGIAKNVKPWGDLSGTNSVAANAMVWNGSGANTSFCEAIKADGIVVYTIGVGTNLSSETTNILKHCASDTDKYQAVVSGNGMNTALTNVTDSFSTLVITQ